MHIGNAVSFDRVEFANNSRCTVISEAAFDSCAKLEIVCKLPSRSHRSLKRRAFYRCKELKEINLPVAVREIGEEAFYFCAMEELELPPNLKSNWRQCFFPLQTAQRQFIFRQVYKQSAAGHSTDAVRLERH